MTTAETPFRLPLRGETAAPPFRPPSRGETEFRKNLLLSLALHATIGLPWWMSHVRAWQAPPTVAPGKVIVSLVTLGTGRGLGPPGAAGGQTVIPVAVGQYTAFHRNRPRPAPEAPVSLPGKPRPVVRVQPERPRPPLQTLTTVVPALPAAPAAVPSHVAHTRPQRGESASQSPVSKGDGQAPSTFEPPVMIKGPNKIAVPEILRQRGGRFTIVLRAVIHVDGTSEVTIFQSTGMVALDDSLQAAFSGLSWYPAQLSGHSVEIPVGLTIDAGWNTGDLNIAWKGRRPAPM